MSVTMRECGCTFMYICSAKLLGVLQLGELGGICQCPSFPMSYQ